MASAIQWGIIGTGAIAKCFANALKDAETGKLAGAASRSEDKAKAFTDEHGGKPFGSYEAMLADDSIDAVYIAVPHPSHAEWAIKAAEAGKHILCEKPIAMNQFEAMAIFEAAHRAGVFCMEAFMYRCHPQTAKLVELIEQGTVGEVRIIKASFAFNAGFNPEGRLFKNDLGGGGILDVGCYTASISRLVAGRAQGKPFADALSVVGQGHLTETGVDGWACATVKFPGDIIAQLTTGVQVGVDSPVEVFGSEGYIKLHNPYVHGRSGGTTTQILIGKRGEEPRAVEVTTDRTAFSYEADVVGKAIQAGQTQAPAPAMTWDDSMGNLKLLDSWRAAIGLTYEQEKPEQRTFTLTRRPLKAKAQTNMQYRELPGVTKKVSRLVMGVDNQNTISHASVMFDDYIERGGTTFDTAWVYGGGRHETVLGHYIKNRGIREDVVILDKGAHTPKCYPHFLLEEFEQSLDRLQMDYVDIYMMHRDNLEVPVGEFMDVMNDQIKAGRMRAIGVSNWTTARIDEANAYAKKNGLKPLVAASNNFSLAHMVQPVWKGCLTASDPTMRKWFEERQMVLMPWSSQARGFFTDRAGKDKLDDEQLVRCWYSDDNFRRRERAIELAEKKGCTPIQIALAYVLNQKFPTIALIGPRTLEETRTSFPALDIQLSEEEVNWLDLREEE